MNFMLKMYNNYKQWEGLEIVVEAFMLTYKFMWKSQAEKSQGGVLKRCSRASEGQKVSAALKHLESRRQKAKRKAMASGRWARDIWRGGDGRPRKNSRLQGHQRGGQPNNKCIVSKERGGSMDGDLDVKK